ncbi:hypothetical protein MKA58_07995 [[Clostridium] innocuum]|nr:hypothetical protein [[Clostridium] innocuum]
MEDFTKEFKNQFTKADLWFLYKKYFIANRGNILWPVYFFIIIWLLYLAFDKADVRYVLAALNGILIIVSFFILMWLKVKSVVNRVNTFQFTENGIYINGLYLVDKDEFLYIFTNQFLIIRKRKISNHGTCVIKINNSSKDRIIEMLKNYQYNIVMRDKPFYIGLRKYK